MDNITYIRGMCNFMCPARELKLRERQKRLHRFERIQGTIGWRVSKNPEENSTAPALIIKQSISEMQNITQKNTVNSGHVDHRFGFNLKSSSSFK